MILNMRSQNLAICDDGNLLKNRKCISISAIQSIYENLSCYFLIKSAAFYYNIALLTLSQYVLPESLFTSVSIGRQGPPLSVSLVPTEMCMEHYWPEGQWMEFFLFRFDKQTKKFFLWCMDSSINYRSSSYR
jgi:hypothetical protein